MTTKICFLISLILTIAKFSFTINLKKEKNMSRIELESEMNKMEKITKNDETDMEKMTNEGFDSLILSASQSNARSKTDKGNALSIASSDSNSIKSAVNSDGKYTNNLLLAAAESNAGASSLDGNAAAVALSSANSSDYQYDLNGELIEKPLYITEIPISNWLNTDKRALDLGVGAEGDVYIVGIDGRVYEYQFTTNRWILVNAREELLGAVRIDVNYEGTPYAVTVSGEIYYLSCENIWIKLPGCAKDIAAGRSGNVFKLGCQNKINGYDIYRLICKCKCKCRYGCKRYRFISIENYNNFNDAYIPRCDWFRVEAEGTSIDVQNNGWPVVTRSSGYIYSYDGNEWKQLGNLKATDVAVSNENVLFAVGEDKNLYKADNLVNPQFTLVNLDNLQVTGVSSGPFSLPFIIARDGYVLTSAKNEYN
jgi:hypothetical protein